MWAPIKNNRLVAFLAARGPGRFMTSLGVVSVLLATMLPGGIAHAGTGGRYTFMRDDGSYWGTTFPGAGLGEIPFAIDTNGDGRQELAVYYNGRMTIRRDDGTLWGFNFYGGGKGEVPLAINLKGHGDRRQQFAVYYNGRFTWLNDNGTYDGVTFPGAGRLDLPLAVDTNGDGVQEWAVYRAGRFTFLRPDGTIWGTTFPGATADDIPFAIDTNGDGKQELAVYRNGRMTIRRDDGTLWGFNFLNATWDELPLAVDTDGNARQEFTVYNHVSTQLSAKQVLGLQWSGEITIADYSENVTRDRADRSLASMQLADIADGGQAHLSTRCTYASQLPSAIDPDPSFMRFLVEYGQQSPYKMNVLFGQCHSSASSYHHKGKAADMACGTDEVVGNRVGANYGVWHNYESCANNGHWHFSIGGK